MPPLRKPHRIAVTLPQLALESGEVAYVSEGALLLWVTCIELLRRHPGLAVYDAESTPLFPRDGHFAPQHAVRGATPTDELYGPARRDELVWLEAGVPRGKLVIHALGRTGEAQAFEGSGRTFGAQLAHALTSWLAARGLPPLAAKLEAITGDDVVATLRVLGPGLVEYARAWSAVRPPRIDQDGDDIEAALDALVPTAERPKLAVPRTSASKLIANRLPQALRVPGLRVLELVFGDDFSEQLLAADPQHPQALLARRQDPATLRLAIHAAPGWARPYTALLKTAVLTPLEKLAAAGLAALCRPGQLEVLEAAAVRLASDGQTDEAVRIMERAVALHPHDSRAHVALLAVHRHGDRVGAWSRAAEHAARLHGCALDPALPRYPDQLAVDVALSDALAATGRYAEATELRASRGANPLPADARATATAEARAAWFRGDVAGALEAYGRAELVHELDVARFLDTLVATGREEEAPLAWARFAPPPGKGAVARLAAARALLVAGEWRRGLEEVWRVELGEPGRDDHVAIAHLGVLISIMPLEVAEAAIAERLGAGASSLARRMARDVADFIPGAAKSTVIMRALGKPLNLELDPEAFTGFSCAARTRAAIDALFLELDPDSEGSERRAAAAGRRAARRGTKVERPITVVIDPMVAADRLINRWLEPVFQDADRPAAALYLAAQALGRYLAATTAVPDVHAGALRTVAAEALALVRVHRTALRDGDVQALLAVLDPLLRKVDRWVGSRWLAAVERSCGIDERAAGDVAGFAARSATVAARILGPEETAVLAASVVALAHDKPAGWEAAVAAQAARLALHTGHTGPVEWAEATVAQLAVKAIELDDAIDALHAAAYLAEGSTAVPAIHLAKLLAGAGNVALAQTVLAAGLPAADKPQRTAALAAVADAWQGALDIPLQPERAATELFEALQKRDPVRAEKLGRWAVACDPDNVEVNRSLGLALAQQGKLIDALHHLTRSTRDQATQIVAGVLFQHGKLAEALAVLDHASRWYTTAEQWLGFGGIADAAADRVRTERAYRRAYELDPAAFDAAQLEAYSRACSGLGKHDDGVALAQQALERNKHSAVAALYRTTLEQAKERHPTTFVDSPLPVKLRSPAYLALDRRDFVTAAAALGEREWATRRAALVAARHRWPYERSVVVTARASAAASTVLAASVGLMERDAMVCRMMALAIREQQLFARDPLPRLAEQPVTPPAPFIDRVVIPNSKIARISDYVSLLRDLAALPTREALQQFDLDDAGYLEVGKAWGAALAADPSLAAQISAGLAKG